jgi:acetyltransferase-like isoleucine patch superfamily enzyme
MINRIVRFVRKKIYFITYKNKFKLLHPESYIHKLLRVDGMENISIHKKVVIQKMTWIAAKPIKSSLNCDLIIGEGTTIGNFNHIYATRKIYIGKNVLTADKVFISDNTHNYENINVPIINQGIKQLSNVEIGDGSWIGENAIIIGAKIGKNCVIGANSIVNKDIPDYCIAVGSPAKIIKKYNLEKEKWERF